MKQIAWLLILSVVYVQGLISQDIPLRYQMCTGCSPTIGVDSLGGNYSYGTFHTFVSHDVTSDYGPRERNANNGTYNWHKGIDCKPLAYAGQYNGGRGTVLLAPISGRIFRVSANQGYKHLTISEDLPPPYASKGMGIGHIFNSRNPNAFDNGLQAGNLFLKQMDSFPQAFYAIINLETGVAIGQVTGIVTLNGVQYDVITEVTDTMAVAPMGGSGGSNYQDSDPFTTHFHIDYYRNVHGELGAGSNEAAAANRLDPFLVLEHEIPEFDVRIQSQGQDFGNIQLKYPGSQPTKLRVRPVMEGATNASGQPLGENGASSRYGNVVMNVDNVDVMIKSSAEAGFSPIMGKSYESRMSHGGRPASSLYPATIYQSASLGHFNKQGIDPYAYHDSQGYPYDEYFFPDFYTRIHKDHSGGTLRTAELPTNARYPDGNYALFGQVTNIRGQVTGSDTISFTLDNFKPYVQQVAVSQQSSNGPPREFHNLSWMEDNNSDLNGIGKLNLNPLLTEPIHIGAYQLKIEAITSEPMEELTLSIPALNEDSTSFTIEELENGTKGHLY
jgi:hypothetical protein